MGKIKVSDFVEFNHNGVEYNARLDMYINSNLRVIDFTYKSIHVNESFDDSDISYWHIAVKNCEIIDKLGREDYKKYSEYRDEIKSIDKNNIVIDNKVYRHYYNDDAKSGSLVYHYRSLKMEDGITVYGAPNSEFFDKDKYDYYKTLRNIQNNAMKHFEETGALPSEEYLEKELTKKYNEMKNWINDKVKI